MICNANGDTNITACIEILQQCVHDALYLSNFLRIISKFGNSIEFIQKKNAPISI
ncbi:hypothetical protein SAMN04487845_1369 [Methylobacterium sp. yr668]|nr:hypothetical protein SAMN04487845_1369 [Methylobacterium sp. yr668]